MMHSNINAWWQAYLVSIKIHIILYCKCKHTHIQVIIIIIIITTIIIIVIINIGNDITVSWIFRIYTTSCYYSKFAIIYILNRGVLKYHN